MKIAYFDTIAGVSGDMTLGAFVSAGLPIDRLAAEIRKLGLDGVELQASHIVRSGITAVKVDVVISPSPGRQEHHRHVRDIFETIDGAPLSVRVKDTARKIFLEVARAEAKVHNTAIDKVHFHEVGALDSIVDIVGAACCVDLLGIDAVYSSPVKLGSGGFIEAGHGKLPIPGPAAVEILRGYPTILTAVPHELTTPTGAAIIKALSLGTLQAEAMKVESVGYGAGTREMPQLPNLLRIMIGEIASAAEEQDEVLLVETNIDDMNPEIYPFVMDEVIKAGAIDAYMTPVIMKKGRPGIVLSVITGREALEGVLARLFAETSTLGVRVQPAGRRKLRRSEREVETPLGKVRMKVAFADMASGGGERLLPEYEECKRLAAETGVPLIEVYRILMRL